MSTIKVICRFRPLNTKEKAKNELEAITFDEQKKTIRTKDGDVYSFDRVFQTDSTQEDLFIYSIEQTVADVMKGYNGTVLAYGQTGSGKTYTMMGSNLEDQYNKGIIPRIVDGIFQCIINSPNNIEFTVNVSFLEIYKEKIKDLLNATNDNLPVHEDKRKGVYVKGLTEYYVSCAEEIFEVMKLGNTVRSVAETKMNLESSRSHTIFILSITQKDTSKGTTKKGKLYLVDLAGSEKVSKTGATGQTLEEAKNINKSLSSLGLVINALSESKISHVPYRNSKLTRILQESLGGNSRTTLIINCSPSLCNLPETLSTLRFGERAKKIKNNAKINHELSPEELKNLVKKLKLQLNSYKENYSTLSFEVQKWRSGEKVEKSDYANMCDNIHSKFEPMSQDTSFFDMKDTETASGTSSRITNYNDYSTDSERMKSDLIKNNQVLSVKVAELSLIKGRLENELNDIKANSRSLNIQSYIEDQSKFLLNFNQNNRKTSVSSTISETVLNETLDKTIFEDEVFDNVYLERNTENLKVKVEAVSNENKLMKNFIHILRKQIDHYHEKEHTNRENNKLAEEEYSKMIKNILQDKPLDKELKQRLDQYTDQVNKNLEEINELRNANEESMSQNYSLQKTNKELESKIKILENEKKKMASQIEILNSKKKLDKLEKKLQIQSEEFEKAKEKSEKLLEERYEKITQLENTLSTAKNDYLTLLSNNEQYNVYKSNISQLKIKFSVLVEKHKEVIENLMQLKRDKTALTNRIKYKDEKIDDLLQKNSELLKRLDSLNDKLITQTEVINGNNSELKHIFPLLSRYSQRVIKPLRGQAPL